MPTTYCPRGQNPDLAIREMDETIGAAHGGWIDERTAGEYRSDWSDLDDAPQDRPTLNEKSVLVKKLLEHGFTLHEIARMLGTSPTAVAEPLTYEATRPGVILQAEKMLRDGVESHRQIAKYLKVSSQTIDRLATSIGVRSKAADRRAAGGGYKHDAETLGRIEWLRSEGHSHGAIAAMTGLSRNTVKSHCRRAALKAAA
jgi:transposase